MNRPPEVLNAIATIAEAISVEGIGKSGRNEEDGYAFRRIEDILEKLAPLLAKNKLVITPNVISRECVERRALSSGAALFYVTVRVRYDFTSSVDGSTTPVEVYGEAMDVSDKATNKAMTAAYKVAVTQAFCIADRNGLDADKQSHTPTASMPADEREKHQRAIMAAPDSKLAQTAFKLATAAATRVKDEEARKLFTQAKKDRLAQLDAAKNAATTNTEATA